MSWQEIFNGLNPGMRLAIGIGIGIFIYAVLRFLVYLANKDAKELGITKKDNEHLSEADKLKRLISMGQE